MASGNFTIPKGSDGWANLPLYVTYIVLGSVIALGNVVIVCAVLRYKALRESKVHLIIGGLAVADAFHMLAHISAGVFRGMKVFDGTHSLMVRPWYCWRALHAVIWAFSHSQSTMMLCVVSLDRLFSVTRPLQYLSWKPGYARKMISFTFIYTWAMAALGIGLTYETRNIDDDPEIYMSVTCIPALAFNRANKHHADPTPRNARGETALDLAARFGRAAFVRSLVIDCPALVLQAAAESSALSDQKPASLPLHLAAKNGHLEVVTILLDAGFDIDFITEQGSALHVAALFGKIQVVKSLLNRRIATDSRDFQGRTVLEVLEEHENERASDLTQLMQNRDAWTECRRLIQDYITNQSTKDSTKNGSIQNGSVAMKRYENPNPQIELQGSPVWQRLPSSTADKIKNERPRHKSEDIPTTVLDGKHYRPPSLQAVFVEAEDAEIEQFELASTISLCTTIRDPAM